MRILIAFCAAALLCVTGCAGSSSGGTDIGTGTVQTVKVAVQDGKVSPAMHRESIGQGDTVRLEVTTDTADEIHVHGYDLKKDVAAGETGTIEFVADQRGLFEVELENAALQLVQLEVN